MSDSKEKKQDGFVFTPIQGPVGELAKKLLNEYAAFEKIELRSNSDKTTWDGSLLARAKTCSFAMLYRLCKLDGGPLRAREDLIKMYEIVSTSEDFDQMNREAKEDLRLSYSEIKELLEAAADIFNINSPMQGHRATSVEEE